MKPQRPLIVTAVSSFPDGALVVGGLCCAGFASLGNKAAQ